MTTSLLVAGAAEMDLEGPLAEYAREGYARLGRVVSDEGLEALRARSDDLMLGRVTYPGLFFQRDTESGRYEDLEYGKGFQGPTLNYRKIEKLEKDPLFLALLRNELFARIARRVLGERVTLYRAMVFNKAAHGGTPLPWHQDGGVLWGLDRDPALQLWVALDDAPVDAGCVEMLPRTHLEGLATPLGGMIPRALTLARDADAHAVPVPARAGEALIIHNMVWHRSGVNGTASPRRAFNVCYLDAETRCVRKKREPRSFFAVF